MIATQDVDPHLSLHMPDEKIPIKGDGNTLMRKKAKLFIDGQNPFFVHATYVTMAQYTCLGFLVYGCASCVVFR